MSASILDILNEVGFVVGHATRPGDSPAVRDTLNALNNGSDAVVVFGKGVSDDYHSMVADATSADDSTTLVVRDDNYTAAQLSGAATSRAANKLGREVKRSNPIRNEDGSEIVGYIMRETV